MRERRALAPDRHLAVFDLEHTLIASNVVDSYAWLASRHLDPDQRVGFVADLLGAAPRWLGPRPSRPRRLPALLLPPLRGGPGRPRCERDAWDLFHEFLLPRSFPAGLARVRQHRGLGHRTLLITGALDVVVDPAAAALRRRGVRPADRAATASSPAGSPSSPRSARPGPCCSSATPAEHGLSLDQSVAYADSSSDLAMLEAVGFPVAVNPDARLAAIARRRGWHVEHWTSRASGRAPARLLPIGRRSTRQRSLGRPATGARR